MFNWEQVGEHKCSPSPRSINSYNECALLFPSFPPIYKFEVDLTSNFKKKKGLDLLRGVLRICA